VWTGQGRLVGAKIAARKGRTKNFAGASEANVGSASDILGPTRAKAGSRFGLLNLEGYERTKVRTGTCTRISVQEVAAVRASFADA
jgi:hypothetical protein